MTSQTPERLLRCPRCGKMTRAGDNPFRPFCSQRCKLIDLGAWLGQDYRIPAQPAGPGGDAWSRPEDPEHEG